MALLQVRFNLPHTGKEWIMDSVRNEISRFLGGEVEGYKAWKSAEAFLESLWTYQYDERYARFKDRTDTILDNIESKYFNKFKKACYVYYRREYVEKLEKDDKENLRKLLARVN